VSAEVVSVMKQAMGKNRYHIGVAMFMKASAMQSQHDQ
jgi:hypothetical protein